MYSSQRKFSNNHIQMTIYMNRENHYVRQCVLLMVLEKSNQILTVLASHHFRKPYPACKKMSVFHQSTRVVVLKSESSDRIFDPSFTPIEHI